jgi:hypothetical protein
MCDKAKEAGTVEKTRRELIALDNENVEYMINGEEPQTIYIVKGVPNGGEVTEPNLPQGREEYRDIHVRKTVRREAGSCNGCIKDHPNQKIYEITIGNFRFRVCDKCRKELSKQLNLVRYN